MHLITPIFRRTLSNPIFVIGHYRSGTTILQRTIGQHNAVYLTGFESPAINDFGNIAYKYKTQDWYRVSTLLDDQIFKSRIKNLIFETYAGKNFALRKEFGKLRRLDFSLFKVNRWVSKIFPSQQEYEGLEYLFPELRSTYILRNGINQVNSSSKHQLFKHISFEDHCKNWVRQLIRFEYLEKKDNCFICRQEDLINNPNNILRELFIFLNLSYSKAISEYVQNTIIHPYGRETQTVTKSKDFYSQRGNAYDEWTSSQKEIFKKICGDKMEDYNYEVPF